MTNCIGIDISGFLKSWNDSMIEPIKIIKELGYDSVEFPINDPFTFSPKMLTEELRKYSLKCSCGTGLTAENNIFSAVNKTVENGILFLKKAIDVTFQMGSSILGGVIFAPWGQVSSRMGMEKCYNNATESLKVLGDYACTKGIVLCIEVINRYESSYINTLEEARAVLDKVASPNVKAHFDSYHSNIEEKDIAEAVLQSRDYIGHVHFSDNDRGYPGSGHIDFPKIINSLNIIKYEKAIVMECFVTPKCGIGNDTYTWRNIDDSAMETAYNSIKNVKKWLKEQG